METHKGLTVEEQRVKEAATQWVLVFRSASGEKWARVFPGESALREFVGRMPLRQGDRIESYPVKKGTE
jgi:hypothetical protein